ncbi:MAG: hypothetical protein M3N32_09655 [Actinomycetota bacterium]|nr:hypothetical protein [Actinomycetota bacterium]
MTTESSDLGVHRSIDPTGVLPHAAWRLDNRPQLWPSEARVDVELLALDPVVLRRLREPAPGGPSRPQAGILETVAERSKLQDPTTGAGGSLLGRICEIGPDHPRNLRLGTRVALPSALGLTPLWLVDVAGWDGVTPFVPARGHAIVFARTPLARVPDDVDARLALTVLEVSAVSSVVRRLLHRADQVAILGGAGAAGALASVAAREGGAAGVVSVVGSWREACLVESLGAATPSIADLGDPLATAAAVREGLGGFADLAVACADVPDAEGGALLATRPGGTAVFAASPLTVAGLANVSRSLGADVELVVASGQVSGAAEDAFQLLHTHPALATLLSGEASLASAWSIARADRR